MLAETLAGLLSAFLDQERSAEGAIPGAPSSGSCAWVPLCSRLDLSRSIGDDLKPANNSRSQAEDKSIRNDTSASRPLDVLQVWTK